MPCSLAARRRGQRCWKTPYALRLLLWQLRRADALLYPGAFCHHGRSLACCWGASKCPGMAAATRSKPEASTRARTWGAGSKHQGTERATPPASKRYALGAPSAYRTRSKLVVVEHVLAPQAEHTEQLLCTISATHTRAHPHKHSRAHTQGQGVQAINFEHQPALPIFSGGHPTGAEGAR